MAFSPQKRWLFYLGGSALFLGLFFKFASEFLEGEVTAVDQTVLAWVTAHRRPVLNAVAVEVTALGAKTVLTVLTGVGLLVFAIRKRWRDALFLTVGMAAVPLGISIAKHLYARPRPPPSMQLATVTGFSYPSGHSTAATVFYLLIAVLLIRQFPSPRIRVLVLGCALVLIAAVCSSRVYLGVHYPSDVLSGFLLGSAWVLFLTAFK